MRLFDPEAPRTQSVRPTMPLASSALVRLPAPGASALECDFPAVALSQIGEHESWRKEVHRPATSTHKWWAKRLGSVFRGIITASVTESSGDALAAYSSGIDLSGLRVFDPFAGSGTTLVEAAKLGAETVGWDINPVATLVQRQAIQGWNADVLSNAYRAVERACRSEIDRLHRTESGETVLYYFWVARADCPECSAVTRLFSTQVFSRHVYPKREPRAHLVCPVCLDVVSGRHDSSQATCVNGHVFSRTGAVAGRSMTCPNGHVSPIVDALDGAPPAYEMYAKIVLGFDGRKRYEPISAHDRDLFDECVNLVSSSDAPLLVPTGCLDEGENTRQALRWGFRRWRQFFNARQLYSLGLIGSTIRDLDVGESEREALAALFSGTLEFNNLFSSFKGEGTGAVRHMFSHHVLKPERMPLEAHPWGTPASSGSFSTLYESRLRRAHAYKGDPADQVLRGLEVERIRGVSRPLNRRIASTWDSFVVDPGSVYLRTGDASATDLPDASIDLVVTDPPYMDNVHYSELADFFHAWLRGIRPYDGYPEEIHTTRSSKEVQSPSADDFEVAIAAVWRECARVLKDTGILAFTFHQARISGWSALVKALAAAGFLVTAIQPVKGEMSTSSTKHGREPSNLDAVVVCRKGQGSDHTFQLDPRRAAAEGEARLSALLDGGVSVGDGDVRSVIRGHVLAIYTRDPCGRPIEALERAADDLADAAIAARRAPADITVAASAVSA